MASEQRQLVESLQDALLTFQAALHTSTVAEITAITGATVSCQVVISQSLDGNTIDFPDFVDVPIVTLQGGGSYQAYPVKPGDYCLLIFTERCFDRWWAGDDNQQPAEYRMHDYSDGLALVGINPEGGAINIPDTIERIGDIVMTGKRTHTGDTVQTGDHKTIGNIDAITYSVGDVAGWSGTFATGDSRTVTVINGIITAVG